VHHIDTGSAPPVFAHPWQLDPEKHCIAEEEFLAIEKAGIIRRSNSPWASPLHLVPKKDGSWRPCGDYRRLNAVTIPKRYLLPNMQSLNDRMGGSTVFRKLTWLKPITRSPSPKRKSLKWRLPRLSAYGNFREWLLVSEMRHRPSSGSKTMS
jgi:hypothetical protein